jgi:hypothetical protein
MVLISLLTAMSVTAMACETLRAVVFVSDFTLSAYKAELLSYEGTTIASNPPQLCCMSFSVIYLKSLSSVASQLEEVQGEVALDFTWERPYSTVLKKALETRTLVLLMYDALSNDTDDSVIKVEVSAKFYAEMTRALMKNLGWSRSALIIEQGFDPTTLEQLGDSVYVVAESLSQRSFETLVGTEIKAGGILTLVVKCGTACTSAAVSALSKVNLGRPGYAFVISQLGSLWGKPSNALQETGLLYLAEKETETASTFKEWISLKLKRLASQLCISKVSASSFSLSSLRQLIANSTSHLSLINIQAKERLIIGSLSAAGVTLSAKIVFPGGVTTFNPNFKTKIKLTMCSSMQEPKEGSSPLAQFFWNTALNLIRTINQSTDILPNFTLEPDALSIGVLQFDMQYIAQQATQHKGKYGVAIIGAVSPVINAGLAAVLRDMNYTIPMIMNNWSPDLQIRAEWPWIYGLQPNPLVMRSNIFRLFILYGWKKVALLFDDPSLLTLYEQAARAYQIEVVNSPDLRLFHYSNETYVENIKPGIEDILKTKVRVVICSSVEPIRMLNVFYESGVKEGDIVFFSPFWLLNTFVGKWKEGYPDDDRYRIMIGAGILATASYVGEFGKAVQTQLIKGPGTMADSFSCLYYDSVWLLSNTLDWMIRRGRDFEDSKVLQKAILNSRFEGCSGKIIFSENSIERSLNLIDILNVQEITKDSPDLVKIGQISPFTARTFTFTSNYTFAFNSTTPPPDTFTVTYECGYPQDEVVEFSDGKHLAYGIYAAICILAGLCTYKIWRRFWRRQMEVLSTSYEISFDDFMLILSIVIEFFQYLSLGPDLNFVSPLLATLGKSTTIDLDKLVSMNRGVFWGVLQGILGLCLAWFVAWLALLFQVDERCKSWVTSYLASASYLLLPLIGNVGFLPIVATIMNTMMCPLSVGVSFKDSLLAKDCYEHCWTPKHNLYVSLSLLSLVVYLPLAILMRPAWQELQPMLHVKTLPLYLMAKSILQISLAVLDKAIKPENPAVHAGVYLGFVIVFLGFIVKTRPYNYARANVWLQGSFVAVVWSTVLAIVTLAKPLPIYMSLSACFGGWALITGKS